MVAPRRRLCAQCRMEEPLRGKWFCGVACRHAWARCACFECCLRIVAQTGATAFRGSDVEDEEEEPDPAVVAAAAAADQQALVAAIGDAVEHSARTLEIERLRMRLEDVR